MESQPTTLTPADLQRFERNGYVVVRQAFPRADALAMEGRWWSELGDMHGIRRDDRSSWRQIAGDLKAAKRDPIQARILTGRVRGVFDDLLGAAAGAAACSMEGAPACATTCAAGCGCAATGRKSLPSPTPTARSRRRLIREAGRRGSRTPDENMPTATIALIPE